MNILFVYPEVMETFWSFTHALKIVGRKAAFPPLGALTVAAMLPSEWNVRLVDMNVENLKDSHLEWADYVWISAMVVQRPSTEKVIEMCQRLGKKIVAGGPLFLCYHKEFSHVDHLILGEAEEILPEFIDDLRNGTARSVYESKHHPELINTPIPAWHLIQMNCYVTMSVQYSRGCPYDCEFCDIIIMNGRRPRTKTNEQMLLEFDALYDRGWRGSVFIVDDNFIGNKKHVKSLLKDVISWQRRKKYPFSFFTEASVDLADDEELMDLMVKAGFNKVFLGLETPEEESLKECGKYQNLRRSLSDAVGKIHHKGLAVMGGFIIGFDNDKPDIFRKQFEFIQENGIVTAMIGLLTAIPTTRLYKRLQQEGRLLFDPTGDNTDHSGTLNFVTRLDRNWIIEQYQKLMKKAYDPQNYYQRMYRFLETYRPRTNGKIVINDVMAFLRSLWFLGIRDRRGVKRLYWKSLFKTLIKYPRAFVFTVTYAIYGYHFRKLFWESN